MPAPIRTNQNAPAAAKIILEGFDFTFFKFRRMGGKRDKTLRPVDACGNSERLVLNTGAFCP